ALRSALALDNAELYEASQRELRERRAAETREAEARAHAESLNERLLHAMRETHHRVKNNLQIVAAVIDLQLVEHADTVTPADLVRIATVVKTLASVHDLLTRQIGDDGSPAFISVKAMLERLLSMIKETTGKFKIEHNIDEVQVPSREATALA